MDYSQSIHRINEFLRRHGQKPVTGASESEIRGLSSELGIELPMPVTEWLRHCRGVSLPILFGAIHGVSGSGAPSPIEVFESGGGKFQLLCVYTDGAGCRFCLCRDMTVPAATHPVVLVEPAMGTDITCIVASSLAICMDRLSKGIESESDDWWADRALAIAADPELLLSKGFDLPW